MRRFLDENGLSNNVVYAAIPDKTGKIWCSTNKGISCYLPLTNSFQNYTNEDGLQSNEYNQGAFFKDAEGKIYFGGIDGLNIFDPKKITANTFIPPVVITAMEIQYKPITPESHPDILDSHISETKQLVLNHKQNTFSFEFTALSFSLPERNMYQYSLSRNGEPDQWIRTGNRRFATYTNIQPGHYTFKVKGSNSDGIWNETPASVEIFITPPFWQTWWFRIFVLILFVLFIYLIFYIRLRNIRSQKKLLEKRVEAKTQRLLKQKEQIENQNRELKEINEKIVEQSEKIIQKNKLLNNQHEKISKQRDNLIQMAEQVKEANQTKLRFFTSISHELRTPLTLIIGPLKEMISKIEHISAKELQRKFSIVYGNASKLLLIVNQLLDFRKVETDNMKMSVSKFDMVSFVQKTAFLFNDLATRGKYRFTFISKHDHLKIWADKEKLEKVIYNLLSNAFKHTSEEGEISISLATTNDEKLGKAATITVKDNGAGMDEEKIPLIFERFYQLDPSENYQSSGSGLGLAIAKKYIELHHGSITVYSAQGKGSSFVVHIPLSKNHFGDDIKLEERQLVDTELLTSSIGEYSPVTYNTVDTSEDRQKPLLLLIEDDKNLRLYLKDILSEQYRIVGTDNSKKGKELAISKHPELIVCDVMLPDNNGFEFCEQIKKEFSTSHIPVILLSALADNQSNMNGLKAGADAYITKPFDLQHLILNIENLIEGRRRLQKKFDTSETSNFEEAGSNSSDQIFLNEAIKCVENNLDDSTFNVENFCSQMRLSQPQVYRKIKALTGLNITEFIRNIRLKKAAQLLRTGNFKINEVAYETGFNDPNYFTKSFIKLYGMTPSDYAKSF
ncbi:MAG: response regulator [Bacteroidetes bacterium]|nr:response regulator [Bacteroidota bacterium]